MDMDVCAAVNCSALQCIAVYCSVRVCLGKCGYGCDCMLVCMLLLVCRHRPTYLPIYTIRCIPVDVYICK